MFESDPDWISAMELTFRPYSSKVTIVNKMVADKTRGEYITIDDYLKDKQLDFLKADIEGYELKMLEGSRKTLQNNHLSAAICTYHEYDHAEKIEKFFAELGYETSFSKGWVFPKPMAEKKPPYLTKCLLFASKANA